ncbi:TraK family protein [Nitrosomonas mobilis]|uniref:Conjugal transfer protein TraK n=1 Tax=Nitrosomonas mobilis TaxID=51642 RepID=A0A1G5SIQ8_9PROT|nr:TraK family protein [Nitrosomonas mobilis]SCZ86421.1 hypothetical protein NSMM_540024 [Nitrosomonas mobilis]
MEKDILNRLAEGAEKSSSTRAKKNFSVVLALRDQIEVAIDSGWTIKDIWQLFQDEKKIDISYQIFLRLVKKYTSYESKNRVKKENILIKNNLLSEPEDNIKIKTHSSKKQDRTLPSGSDEYAGSDNPKGFEWSNEYNIDDLV